MHFVIGFRGGNTSRKRGAAALMKTTAELLAVCREAEDLSPSRNAS